MSDVVLPFRCKRKIVPAEDGWYVHHCIGRTFHVVEPIVAWEVKHIIDGAKSHVHATPIGCVNDAPNETSAYAVQAPDGKFYVYGRLPFDSEDEVRNYLFEWEQERAAK